jgi:acetyltransferase-like isoleucine patch superfamily enzyme
VRRHPALAHDWFPEREPANVRIGERSHVWSAMAFLRFRSEMPDAVRIGDDTGLYWGTYFDLGPRGQVEIGDFCTLASPVFAVDTRVVVGSHALISFDVVIADSFAAVPPPARESRDAVGHEGATSIVVGDDAWVGMRSVLLPGARLGRGAIVGAATVVDSEVPEYAIVAGNPARIVGWAPPEAPGAADG